mmetsp:Transcript_7437/g.16258  ORF Transcript_7437/g.16258 Transcript_7437/m.16258 type:complete len:610 (-) Transcript_7437:677-2506(-)
MSSAAAINGTGASAEGNEAAFEYPYADGETIPQEWNGVFIFFAFVTSFVASYSAVRLLDHDLWRTEKEKDHASAIIIRHPQAVSAVLLGFGTVWAMHFIGMAAVTLDKTSMCYNWPITLGSLASAVVFMWLGVYIACKDVFHRPDRLEKLKKVVISSKDVTAKGRQKQAERTIHMVAFFYRPWYVLGGATVAAAGALIMHYTGMEALQGPFRKVWSVPYVSASVVLGVVICSVGFWILFRLLLWKVEKFWLRPASAAVISLGVCTLHFFGMLSVTYEFDESLVGTCRDLPGYGDPVSQVWTRHQIVCLAVGIFVPSLALLIENMICRELFHAYAKLKDPALTVEFILEAGMRSRNTNIRRASLHVDKALKGSPTSASQDPIGMEHAAALVASADEEERRGSVSASSLTPSRRGSAKSGSSGVRRRSSLLDVNGGGATVCTCTCGGCHPKDGRRVSFLRGTASVDHDDAPATKRGSTYSGSAGSFVNAVIAENPKSQGDVWVSETSSAKKTSENSLLELATQIRQLSAASAASAASEVEERQTDSVTTDGAEGTATIGSQPESLEERASGSSPSAVAPRANTSEDTSAAVLEAGVSDTWEEDKLAVSVGK